MSGGRGGRGGRGGFGRPPRRITGSGGGAWRSEIRKGGRLGGLKRGSLMTGSGPNISRKLKVRNFDEK
jgi:hypothetical protein